MITYLRLIRLPNTLTTVADVLAGAAVATAGTGGSYPLAPLALTALATIFLYAFGMALNDLVDADKDRRLHPERPLPSGALEPGTVRLAVVGLAVSALMLLGVVGAKTLVLGAALVGAVFLYDVVLKSVPLVSSVAMGACRGLTGALGCAAAGGYGAVDATVWSAASDEVLIFPLGYLALVTFVTAISAHEEASPDSGRPLAWLVALALAYLVPAAVARYPTPIAAASAVLAWYVIRPAMGSRPAYGLVVRNAVFTLVVFDALVAAGVGAWVVAAICLALFPLIRLLAHAIRQRGA